MENGVHPPFIDVDGHIVLPASKLESVTRTVGYFAREGECFRLEMSGVFSLINYVHLCPSILPKIAITRHGETLKTIPTKTSENLCCLHISTFDSPLAQTSHLSSPPLAINLAPAPPGVFLRGQKG